MDDLRSVYGDELLSYVLATEGVAEHSTASLSSEQLTALDLLKQIAAKTLDQHPLQRPLGLANMLLVYVNDSDTTLANHLRKSCGGAVPECPTSDDEVSWRLLRFARDLYPAYLLPSADEGVMRPRIDTFGGLFRHPHHMLFCRAALKDERLKLLFPGIASNMADSAADNELLEVSSVFYYSSGRGGGFQLAMLASTILNSAWVRAGFLDKRDIDGYLQISHDVLEEVCQLARGKTVNVPLVLSFDNVGIPGQAVAQLPWGTLRHRKPTDDQVLGGDRDARLVLVGQAPLQILRKEMPRKDEAPDTFIKRFEQFNPKFEAWNKTVERTSYLTRYALMLASPETPYFAAEHIAQSVLDPLYQIPQSRWRADNPILPAPSTILDAETLSSVEEWGSRLAKHPRNLDTSMRRTVSAVASRVDPVDGFVDAVLAWENMFSDTPETTFKVCGSIAVLLEHDDFHARLELFKQLQDLYRKRSTILHGGEEPGAREATGYRDRAVKIALDCMRRLYEREDLLLLGGAAQRGKYVLLGVPLIDNVDELE